MLAARFLIFNLLYFGLLRAIELYDSIAYGEQAMPGMAHPSVIMALIMGFFLVNVIYAVMEIVASGTGLLRRRSPAVQLLFPAGYFLAIVICFVAIALVAAYVA